MMVIGNKFLLMWVAVVWVCFGCLARAAEAPEWGRLKMVDRLWMGFEEGEISPAAVENVKAEFTGELLLLAKDRAVLKKEQDWATQEPKQLEMDREAVQLEKRKLAQFLKESKVTQEDAIEQAETALEELERKREELEAGMGDAQFPEALRGRAKEALVKLGEKISAARVKVDPKSWKEKLAIERREKEMVIEKKEKELELLRRRVEWRAREGGVLVYSNLVREKLVEKKASKIWVRAGDQIATITNHDYYEVAIGGQSPLMQSLPREEMEIALSHPRTGVAIRGKLSRAVDGDGVTKLYFRLDSGADDLEKLQQNSKLLVQVFRVFPKKVRFVMKRDLAFVAPDVLSQEGWSGVVHHVWPKARILQIGSQGIAVEGEP